MSDLLAKMLMEMVLNGGAPGAPLAVHEINFLQQMLDRAGWRMLEDVPGFVRTH